MPTGLVEVIRLRTDPDLRDALKAAARAQQVSMSELVRRQLRTALAPRAPQLREAARHG